MTACLYGFQVELLQRCIYGIVHPDDQVELQAVLERTLPVSSGVSGAGTQHCDNRQVG